MRCDAEPKLFVEGEKDMIDHLLVSIPLLLYHRTTEIHDELLHDESVAFVTDDKYPRNDHAPMVAHFEIPPR